MKQYIIITLTVVLLFLFAWPAAAEPKPASLDDTAELEAFLNGIFASQLAQYRIAGATVAVVKDGTLLFAKGYGYADLERRVPVDPERTLFRPGSASKLFVWTAVMQLVEQGKLDLDTDINRYLAFEIPARLFNGAEARPVTMADLMAHAPGFEDMLVNLFVLDEDKLLPLGNYLKTFLPQRVYPPGELGAYSNYGSALAAYMVERLSGMPFEEYVERHIFTTLEMDRSTLKTPALISNRSSPCQEKY